MLREVEALAAVDDDVVVLVDPSASERGILHAQGRLDEAERYAREAVAFGGADRLSRGEGVLAPRVGRSQRSGEG